MSYSFNAAPRVIRQRRRQKKAREFDTTQYTPWELERKHVKEQEEQLKIMNMKKQLENFKMNKRMRPFDIKPSPHPRIPVNLQFFITDDLYIKKPELGEAEAQTDELVGAGAVETRVRVGKEVEYIPEQTYIPKKTGVDVYSQVENDELFDFDREVQPILDILITKTLEQSMLELEEDQEIENMIRFKENYVDKKCKKTEKDWEKIMDVEIEKMDEKEVILNDLTFKNILQTNLSNKLKAHKIATSYLRDLLPSSMEILERRGFYQNNQLDDFNKEYTDYILGEVMTVLEEDQKFDEDTSALYSEVEPTLTKTRLVFDEQFQNTAQEKLIAKKNLEISDKQVYFYLKNQAENCPLVFSCFLSMLWSNQYIDYELNMIENYEQLIAKQDAGQYASTDEFQEAIEEEMPNPAQEIFSARFSTAPSLGFAFSNNPQAKLLSQDRAFGSKAAFFNEKGEILEIVDNKQRNGDFAKFSQADDYHFSHQESYEELIELDFDQMQTKGAKFGMVYLWGSNFEGQLNDLDSLKVAQYKIFDRKLGVNFMKGVFERALDGLFLVNPQEGVLEDTEQERNCIVGCFLFYYDSQRGWAFDHLKAFAVGYESEQEFLKMSGEQLVAMNHPGNLSELLNYWKKRGDQQQEEQKQKVAKYEDLIESINKATMDAPVQEEEVQEEEENDEEEGEDEQGTDDEYSKTGDASPQARVPYEEQFPERSKEENTLEGQLGAGENELVEGSSTMLVQETGNLFIGPITVDVSEHQYPELAQNLEVFIEEKHPSVLQGLPDGFEVLYKMKPLEGQESLDLALGELYDFRQLRIRRLEKGSEASGEEEGGEEESGNEDDDDDDDSGQK